MQVSRRTLADERMAWRKNLEVGGGGENETEWMKTEHQSLAGKRKKRVTGVTLKKVVRKKREARKLSTKE